MEFDESCKKFPKNTLKISKGITKEIPKKNLKCWNFKKKSEMSQGISQEIIKRVVWDISEEIFD